jgi:hypothetical protein
MRLALFTPPILLANLTEASVPASKQSTPPDECTSITLEVLVP